MATEEIEQWLYRFNIRLLRMALNTEDSTTQADLKAATEALETFLTEVRTNRSNSKEK
jgi:hypothetical protein